REAWVVGERTRCLARDLHALDALVGALDAATLDRAADAVRLLPDLAGCRAEGTLLSHGRAPAEPAPRERAGAPRRRLAQAQAAQQLQRWEPASREATAVK